jgi:hypothetical protein
VSRKSLLGLPVALVLGSCGGADSPPPAPPAAMPAAPQSIATGISPDAGIPQGHAAADARARRCRATHPPKWRYWRYCDCYAR